jgi:hypothetical protein
MAAAEIRRDSIVSLPPFKLLQTDHIVSPWLAATKPTRNVTTLPETRFFSERNGFDPIKTWFLR